MTIFNLFTTDPIKKTQKDTFSVMCLENYILQQLGFQKSLCK